MVQAIYTPVAQKFPGISWRGNWPIISSTKLIIGGCIQYQVIFPAIFFSANLYGMMLALLSSLSLAWASYSLALPLSPSLPHTEGPPRILLHSNDVTQSQRGNQPYRDKTLMHQRTQGFTCKAQPLPIHNAKRPSPTAIAATQSPRN